MDINFQNLNFREKPLNVRIDNLFVKAFSEMKVLEIKCNFLVWVIVAMCPNLMSFAPRSGLCSTGAGSKLRQRLSSRRGANEAQIDPSYHAADAWSMFQ